MSPPVHRLREQTVSTKVEMQPLTPSKLLRPLQGHSAGKDIFNEELPFGAFLSILILDQPSLISLQAHLSYKVLARIKTCTKDAGDMPKPRKSSQSYTSSNSLDEHSKAVTINSRFTICKERNHGVDFQYDDVVKGREERKKLLADDCECCRDVCVSIVLKIVISISVWE